MEVFAMQLRRVRDEYLKNKIIINKDGIYPTRIDNLESFTDASIEANAENMYKVSLLIPWLLEKGKGKAGVFSYDLKNNIQQCNGIYLTNGEIIIVMLTMGYEISRLRNSRTTCNFKCRYANSDAVRNFKCCLPIPTTATP